MPHARLKITLPDRTWIGDVSSEFPEATFRVLAAIPGEDVGFALVELTAPDLVPVLESMVDHEALSSVEPLHHESSRVVTQIETTAPLLLFSARASGVPIEPPVVIEDSVATVELLLPHEKLSELGEQLDRFGLAYTLESVRDGADRDRLLSDRQRELLAAAIEHGYYDVPRNCSLTELAEEFGIAKSTCSEMLHRIESAIIEQFYEHESGLESASPPPMDPA